MVGRISFTILLSCGECSSMAERRTVDPNVGGSTPLTHPIFLIKKPLFAGRFSSLSCSESLSLSGKRKTLGAFDL